MIITKHLDLLPPQSETNEATTVKTPTTTQSLTTWPPNEAEADRNRSSYAFIMTMRLTCPE